MISKYGDFSADGKEFIINTPNIERNWYNYFFNDNYICFTSQAGIGQSFLQDRLGNRIMPVCDRGVYAVCGEHGWNLAGLPVYENNKKYSCIHGLGYTKIQLERYGISTEYGIFVPCEESTVDGYEVIWIKVRNNTDKHQDVKIISYSENTYDSRYTYQGYNVSHCDFSEDINGICYPIGAGDWNGKKQLFMGFTSAGQNVSGYDCARNAFVGPYGSFIDPIAIHNCGCTNSNCIAEKFGFALQTTICLDPGEEGFASFVTGVAENRERINEITSRFSNKESLFSELDDVKEKYSNVMGKLQIETPDNELNKLLNYWLKYQTNMGSRWARVRHNGYRDIASDTECLAAFNPTLAWERIKRLLKYQYSNGYAPRTFEDGAIRDNEFSDCTVWLTFTVYYIIGELGNLSLLDEEVEFNDGSIASVYEHLRRSLDFLYNFRGLHNLIQIWGGDWNDCMDRVGRAHKGVSVWLSIAWYRANSQFGELAKLRHDEKEYLLSIERGKEIKALVEEYGWDENGGYYIYAYNDNDQKIGSSDCIEGKIFLNPQLWAVLSGISSNGRELVAMESVERELTYELGTAVSTPPYTFYDRGIGSMTIKSPGVQENGGVYLHPMCWKLAVDALICRPDLVERDMNAILPFRNPVVAGRAEPYVLCNCYMGKETDYRYGTPGQSWRTATGQWFLKAMLNFVFGIDPKMDGIHLRPCLPSSWDKAKLVKPFRGCIYDISYRKTGIKRIFADGVLIEGDLLPLNNGRIEIICEY